MEEVVKELVGKHFDNLIIDLANDPRIPWEGGDIHPLENLALEFTKDSLSKRLMQILNKEV